jgi:acetyltransferase-like isoleucine patch superfamily enzyme
VIAGVMEPMSSKNVVIEDNVLIGANATVLAGVHIGKNAIIGAGSVVTKDVLENTTVVGVPARVVNNNGEWKLNKDLR